MRMMKIWLATAALALSTSVYAAETTQKNPPANDKNMSPSEQVAEAPRVMLETSLGPVVIELFPNEAPISVENFLQYVDSGFYDGVIFHRVIPNFVVQVGGFDTEYQRKPTRAAIKNESDNGLKNLRGTLSMARTMSPNSATSQFFISLRDNPHLDSQGGPGYAVFGKVVEGMDVVDQLPELPQGNHSGVFMNAPNDPVEVKKAYRLSDKGDGNTPAAAPKNTQANASKAEPKKQ